MLTLLSNKGDSWQEHIRSLLFFFNLKENIKIWDWMSQILHLNRKYEDRLEGPEKIIGDGQL